MANFARRNLWQFVEMNITMMKLVRFHMPAATLLKFGCGNGVTESQNVPTPLKQEFMPSLRAVKPISYMGQFLSLLKPIGQDRRRILDHTIIVLDIQEHSADFPCSAGDTVRQRLRGSDSLVICKHICSKVIVDRRDLRL